jgi:hypothetical protein
MSGIDVTSWTGLNGVVKNTQEPNSFITTKRDITHASIVGGRK